MDPTLRQLRYFGAVVDELSFTRAARRLRISQPSLSVQIRRLEDGLGVELLRRTSRQVELTDAGRSLADDLRRLFADLDRAVDRARRTHAEKGRMLRLAYTASVAYQALPLLLDRLATAAPQLRVVTQQQWSVEAVAAVRSGQADLALVREFAGEEGMRSEVLRREPLVVFLSTRHALARRRSLRVRDLQGHAVVVVPGRLAPGFHDLLGRLCAVRGFTPIEVELASPDNREPLLAHLSRHPDQLFVGPVSMSNVTWAGVSRIPLRDTDARMRLNTVWPVGPTTPAVETALRAARGLAADEGWLDPD